MREIEDTAYGAKFPEKKKVKLYEVVQDIRGKRKRSTIYAKDEAEVKTILSGVISIEMKEKWNIIWRGCELREKGLHIDESYESWMECTQGIGEFDNLEKVEEFWGQQSVSFGEEGGTFNVYGGWHGTYEDLKTGKERFHSKERLIREIRTREE